MPGKQGQESTDELVQITSGYFCAGLVVSGGVVVQAAPILGWARGKSWKWLKSWALSVLCSSLRTKR